MNLWRMLSIVLFGCLILAAVVFQAFQGNYNQLRDMAVRQQTQIIDVQADIIRKQIDEIKRLMGTDNVTPVRPLPPGAPV